MTWDLLKKNLFFFQYSGLQKSDYAEEQSLYLAQSQLGGLTNVSHPVHIFYLQFQIQYFMRTLENYRIAVLFKSYEAYFHIFSSLDQMGSVIS